MKIRFKLTIIRLKQKIEQSKRSIAVHEFKNRLKSLSLSKDELKFKVSVIKAMIAIMSVRKKKKKKKAHHFFFPFVSSTPQRSTGPRSLL